VRKTVVPPGIQIDLIVFFDVIYANRDFLNSAFGAGGEGDRDRPAPEGATDEEREWLMHERRVGHLSTGQKDGLSSLWADWFFAENSEGNTPWSGALKRALEVESELPGKKEAAARRYLFRGATNHLKSLWCTSGGLLRERVKEALNEYSGGENPVFKKIDELSFTASATTYPVRSDLDAAALARSLPKRRFSLPEEKDDFSGNAPGTKVKLRIPHAAFIRDRLAEAMEAGQCGLTMD
jgi:hypothetical protein